MTGTPNRAVRRFVGFLCLLLIVTSVLGLLGTPPTRRWAPDLGVRAMWLGLATCLFASLVGGLPVLFSERRHGEAGANAMLASLVVRFLAVLVGIAYVLFSGLAATTPFLVWTGIGYLILLPLDVLYSLRGRNPTVA